MSLRIIRMLSFLAAVLWALFTSPMDAQRPQIEQPLLTSITAARNPPASVGEALHSLAARSGFVFLGRVDHIDHQPGVVSITIEVLQPVVGDPGPTYTLREWAGLWPAGRQRYVVGQRAMFFLHRPNAGGLSSPVDGQDGVVPLLPTAADQAPLLDVRWLAARIQRPGGESLAGIHSGAIALADAAHFVALTNTAHPAAEPAQVSLPASLRPVEIASATVPR